MRLATSVTLVLIVAALFAVGLAVTSADEGIELPQTFVTVLEPGDNMVGWTGHAAPVDELFEAIPQIELVYTWDADRNRYRFAHPDVRPGSGTLELLTSETPVFIRVGNDPISAVELFDAEPRIRLIYHWSENDKHWDLAFAGFPPRRWTLNTLSPGMTAVIRVESQMTPQELFEALPQIDLIYRFVEGKDRYDYALPGLTPAIGNLSTLRPGMGLVVHLGGDSSIEWVRPRMPAQGTVELRRGRNLVAWLGRDQAPLPRVALGIGDQFQRAGLWSQDEQLVTFYDVDTIANAAKQPMLGFGDALWVDVGRSVPWLQPTGVLPQVIIAGNVSKSLEDDVWRTMRAVLDFFWERFGIEADFSRLQAYFPMGYDAYVDAIERNLPPDRGSITRSDAGEEAFNHIGGAFTPGWNSFFVKLSTWRYSVRSGLTWGHLATAHEYTHVLQHQLSGSRPDWHPPFEPLWMVEGTAEWVEMALLHSAGVSQTTLAAESRRALVGESSLSDTVSGGSEYTVGPAAALTLAPDLSDDTLFDLYRTFAPSYAGPRYRWRSWPTWSDGFAEHFGETVDEFYQRFESERSERRGLGHHYHTPEPPLVQVGLILDDDAAGWTHWSVLLIDSSGQKLSPDILGTSEAVKIPVTAGQDYRVAIEVGGRGRSCLVFWTTDGLAGHYDQAEALRVPPGQVRRLELRVSAACPQAIVGTLVTEADEPLEGVHVTLLDEAGVGRQGLPRSVSPSTFTNSEGKFEFLVPDATSGMVQVELADRCYVDRRVWSEPNSGSGYAGSESRQRTSGLRIEIPDDQCGSRITGRLLDSENNGIGNTFVYFQGTAPGYARTDSDGHFEAYVSSSDTYRIRTVIDGCSVHWAQDGLALSLEQASPIRVFDSDVTGVELKLRNGVCEYRVSGKVLDADGNPIVGSQVSARTSSGLRGSSRTESDGSFVITVPDVGTYWLELQRDGCTVYYRKSGSTGIRGNASPVVVVDQDVTGLEIGVRSSGCSAKISGTLLDAGGKPIADTFAFAQTDDGEVRQVRTDSEGSFSIIIRETGTYRVGARVDGCWVYYQLAGVTAWSHEATEINVGESGISGIDIQLTEGMCELKVSGRLVSAVGTPRSSQWVSVSGSAGSGGTTTTSDGTFSIAVPASGSYRLSVWIDDCSIYRGSSGPVNDRNGASEITVSTADVTGIEFRLPEDPASFCN